MFKALINHFGQINGACGLQTISMSNENLASYDTQRSVEQEKALH